MTQKAQYAPRQPSLKRCVVSNDEQRRLNLRKKRNLYRGQGRNQHVELHRANIEGRNADRQAKVGGCRQRHQSLLLGQGAQGFIRAHHLLFIGPLILHSRQNRQQLWTRLHRLYFSSMVPRTKGQTNHSIQILPSQIRCPTAQIHSPRWCHSQVRCAGCWTHSQVSMDDLTRV